MPFKIVVADPGPSVQKAVQLAFPEPEFRLSFIEEGNRLIEEIAAFRASVANLLSSSSGGVTANACPLI